MNAMLKCLVVATTLAAGGCAVTGGPGYGGGYGSGGYGSSGGYPSIGGYPSSGYPSSGYGGGQRFRCESNDGRQRYCDVDTRNGVQLLRQLSASPCVRGRTWDYDRNGVWVAQGCRGEFAAGQGGQYGGGYPGGYQGGGYPGGGYSGNSQSGQIRCESSDGRTRQCAADTRGGVSLVRQLSSSPCVEGRTWGYGRNSIWVSQGCRGQFATGGGAGYGGNYSGGGSYGQTLRCESADNRQRRCSVPVRSGVQLVRQLSSTRCVEGANWGWDRSGIWVDQGCRGEFTVR